MTGEVNRHGNRRQVLYWRMLSQIFGDREYPALEKASVEVVDDIGLPAALLDPRVSIDTVVQRFPELAEAIDGRMKTENLQRDDDLIDGDEVETAAIVSKLFLSIYQTGSGPVSATDLGEWQSNVRWLERAFGSEPGQLGSSPEGAEVAAAVEGIERELIGRMRLREVLADPVLAKSLTPSMSLVEQLLRDKNNLSGVALKNAKSLIQRYVREIAEILRTKMEQTSVGQIDRSTPPKRVFRNLDLDRTIWKNLTNYSPEDERLYVDTLFYKHSARKNLPSKLIVVVDQSGSMVDSMVNCTILASIFAGLPRVSVELIAFDTRAIDLTPWVGDPFEALLRTNLGGGNDGPVAMAMARPKIVDPKNTVMVWISDFYEFGQSEPLYRQIEQVHRSGVKFIPVGSVKSSGSQQVNPWFRKKLKSLGTPVISGKIDKLVFELKKFLA